MYKTILRKTWWVWSLAQTTEPCGRGSETGRNRTFTRLGLTIPILLQPTLYASINYLGIQSHFRLPQQIDSIISNIKIFPSCLQSKGTLSSLLPRSRLPRSSMPFLVPVLEGDRCLVVDRLDTQRSNYGLFDFCALAHVRKYSFRWEQTLISPVIFVLTQFFRLTSDCFEKSIRNACFETFFIPSVRFQPC